MLATRARLHPRARMLRPTRLPPVGAADVGARDPGPKLEESPAAAGASVEPPLLSASAANAAGRPASAVQAVSRPLVRCRCAGCGPGSLHPQDFEKDKIKTSRVKRSLRGKEHWASWGAEPRTRGRAPRGTPAGPLPARPTRRWGQGYPGPPPPSASGARRKTPVGDEGPGPRARSALPCPSRALS